MKLALTTDHTGFEKLKALQSFLEAAGHDCTNLGPIELNKDDDYPDFIMPAAQAVARGEYEAAIIMGGSGQGEAMAANRIKGARAAVYYGPATPKTAINAEGDAARDEYEILRLSRQHNHANVLSLAARFLDQVDIEKAVTIWLETAYDPHERHARRIQKLDA
jgi:ribose 5-phosphate isomerase B